MDSYRDGLNSYWDDPSGLNFHRDHPGRDSETVVCAYGGRLIVGVLGGGVVSVRLSTGWGSVLVRL